jgi:hypothetical protein
MTPRAEQIITPECERPLSLEKYAGQGPTHGPGTTLAPGPGQPERSEEGKARAQRIARRRATDLALLPYAVVATDEVRQRLMLPSVA